MGKKIREDQLNQVSESAGISGFAPLNHEDIDLIEQKLLPKNRRSFYLLSFVLLAICSVLPYVPGRGSKALIHTMTYPEALFVFCTVFSSAVIYMYYKSLYGIRKDLNNGYKYIFATTIERKVWLDIENFELSMTELPKELSEQKFKFSREESSRWHQGDRIIIEYLRHSETMLREPRVFTSR